MDPERGFQKCQNGGLSMYIFFNNVFILWYG
jgi:hypothetical protein